VESGNRARDCARGREGGKGYQKTKIEATAI